MNCPIDDTELRVSDRQGVEIDYCPKCRGVWLDRGELDKIIERTARTPYSDDSGEVRDEYDDEGRRSEDREHGKRRRRSILEDLFDFG
jgi:uncharacterized protein